MDLVQVALILVAAVTAGLAIYWLSLSGKSDKKPKDKQAKKNSKHGHSLLKHGSSTGANVTDAADDDVEHLFNNEFREELKNRGRLHFEKVINENAMFLQQDLRLTTSQLNDYMKQEIKKVLQEEFSKYEESIKGAKDLAISSIQKTQSAIEEQRQILQQNLTDEVAREKQQIIARFERDMAQVVNHYVLTAIGNEIDLTDQLEYILQYMEDNKEAIIEDLRHGTA